MKKILSIVALATLSASGVQAQTFPNDGFETWVNYSSGFPPTSLARPANWFSADSLIHSPTLSFIFNGNVKKQMFKTADAHTGSSAVLLYTVMQDTTLVPGVATNAKPLLDLMNYDPNNPLSAVAYEGGTPITQKIDQVKAWVKGTPKGLVDNGTMVVQVVKAGAGAGGKDSVVGTGTSLIPANNNYTQISTPVTYTSTLAPDKILVLFMSSVFLTAVDSSLIMVDDVTMVPAMGIEQTLMDGETINVFPNPASNVISVSSTLNSTQKFTLTDVMGRVVMNQEFKNSATWSIAALAKGTYVFNILNDKGILVRTGKVLLN